MAEDIVSQDGDQIEVVAKSGGAAVTYHISNVQRTEYPCSDCESSIVVLEGGVDEYLQGPKAHNVYFYAMIRSCPSNHLSLGLPDHIGGPRVPVVSPQLLDFGTLTRGSKKTVQTVVANTNTSLSMNWHADVGGATWLSLDINHGTIQPGHHQLVNVTAHTSTLSPGSHTAILTISSNTGTTTSQVSVVVN